MTLAGIRHRLPVVRVRLRWRRRRTLASLIWKHFASQPGFREELRQARADLAEGRAIPLREIPRER